MRAKKINFKKILSYLLIFTVFFTTVQLGSIRQAKADTTSTTDASGAVNQIDGLKLHLGDTTSSPVKVIDKDASGGYICEYLPTGTNFLLEPESSNYSITAASSSSNKMVVQQVGNNFVINSITDYSDFVLTVSIKDNTNTDPTTNTTTYKITMRFESNSVLEFGWLRVTLDNQSPIPIPYGQVDPDGNYTLKASSAVKTAKVEMLDKNMTPLTCTISANSVSGNIVNLVGGDNAITITRTSQNISKQYKLIISNKGVAKLQSLVPSTGALTPAFNSDTYDYTMTVPTTQTTIAFTPTTVDNTSTIKVNGTTVNSGSKSKNINLDEGDNVIEIVVKTKDGDTSTYTVDVTRTAQFRSAALKSLALTSGTLSPAFNKGIYEYTASVENTVTSIGVTPTAEDANATITVNGKTIPSGATSPNISLNEGGNVITVVVTDTKGNTNTYVVNVTRKYSKNNVNLASLSVTDGTMSPKFDPETYLYSVKVARNIERVKILYTSQNDKSKITIDGKEYTNGQSDYIPLQIGANLVQVNVTSEDGKSTTTYKLSIIRGDIEGTNEWVLVAGDWTFYNADGVQAKNEWVKYDNKWYFLDINGHMMTGWIYESGNWYYLNNDGIMQTGWIYDKGYWYYFQGDGAMRTNVWATYDGKWYFFNSYGQLQTGWTLYLGRWYYLDDHGVMQKGWVTWDKNKYYINDDGTMKTGWLYSGKVWYYLDYSGIMVRGWQTINGKKYYFDANGAMKTGMMFLDGQWINLNNV